MLPRCCWFRSPGGTIFVFTAAASRRLSDSGRGLDIDRPPEWPRGAARPRRRPHHFRHHHRGVAVVSPVALGGPTSTRPWSGREGRHVLVVGLAIFIIASTSPPSLQHRSGARHQHAPGTTVLDGASSSSALGLHARSSPLLRGYPKNLWFLCIHSFVHG